MRIVKFSSTTRIDPSLEQYSDPSEFFFQALKSKPLAVLGDSLINYAYMHARLLVKPGHGKSIKVWDSSLADALRLTPLRKKLKGVKNKGDMGDVVEALIAFTYLEQLVSIEEIINTLKQELEELSFSSETNPLAEKDYAAFAFQKLIELVLERWERLLVNSQDE